MSGTTRRRRHSPAVYRRRRLTVLLGLVLVAAAIWLLIAQPWRSSAETSSAGPSATAESDESTDATTAIPVPDTGGAQTPAPEEPGPETPSSASEPAEEASDPSTGATPAIEPCRARDVAVEAVTDQDTYSSGQNPQLSIRLTNASTADCTINVGTATQSFVISSGSDTWWRSTDCQAAPSDVVVTLKAGQTVTSAAPLVWDRTRSSVSTCGQAERPRAGAGGASYHLSVEIGGFASTQSKQFILY